MQPCFKIRSFHAARVSIQALPLAVLLLGSVAMAAPTAPGAAAPAAAASIKGKVLETMGAADYTYVRVQTASGEVWAAGPHTEVKVGDTVTLPAGVEMKSFRSKALDRTFDSVLFVDRITVGEGAASGGIATLPAPAHGTPGHAAAHDGVNKAPAADVDVTGIAKAKGGKTVGEVIDERTALAGKEVSVRGKVVKSNPGVMGHNWLHIRDGSKGADGSNDLTLTTDGTAAVGDTVLVTGKVVTDKDFGFGYRYSVMLEEAKVTVE